MDSRPLGVPLSATPVAPKAAAAAPPGIRAPLTFDESDFEYSSRRNSIDSSYDSGESEGFVSGEDDYGSASESANLTEQNEGVLEETHFVKDYAFSRPSMVKPNGVLGQQTSTGNAQERDNVSQNAFFGPVVRDSDERVIKSVRNVDGSDYHSSALLSESGDEVGEDEHYVLGNGGSAPLVGVSDEEVSETVSMPVIDMKAPLLENVRIPIAKISGDSDDDSMSSVVSEDDGFSGVVRIPSVELLQRLNSAPKARPSQEVQGDGHDLLAEEDVIDMEFIEGHDLESKDEREYSGVDDSHNDSLISSGSIQDKEVRADLLIISEEHNSESEQVPNETHLHSGEEILEINAINDLRKCADLIVQREPTDLRSNTSVALTAELSYPFTTVAPVEPEVTELRCSSSNFGSPSVDGEHSFKFEMEQNEELKHLTKEIQEMDVICYQKECVDLIDQGAPTAPESASFTPSVEELDCLRGTVKIMDHDVTKSACISKFVDNITVNGDQKSSSTISEDNITFIWDVPSDGLESEREKDVGSLQTCADVMEVSTDCCPQISEQSEALAENMQLDRQVICSAAPAALMPEDGMTKFSLGSNSGDLCSLYYSTRTSTKAKSCDLFETPSCNGKSEEALSAAEKRQLDKIQQIRRKYLWLLHQLGCSPDDSVASQVLYQLTLAEERISSQACHLGSSKKAAVKLEAQEKDGLDCSMCILVIGKSGAGKSSTINSIFGEKKTTINAFEPATTCVKEVVGVKDGVKLKVIDTPGLRSSLKDQSSNQRVLLSIKRLMWRSPPDAILYIDRLDTQTSDLNDLPVLKLITSCLGSSMWQKSILVLTHATSLPPDGANGYPLSYETFVAQRSCSVQQLISHSVGDFLMMNPGYMIPVSLVENHPTVEQNGHRESWKSQLLLLCYSMKTLSEVSSVVTIQNASDIRKMNGLSVHSPSQSYRLSLLSTPNVYGKPSSDQSGESFNSDSALGYSSGSDQDDNGRECNNLLPFKSLKETQISKLNWDKRTTYLQDYHLANLLQKKQMRRDLTLPGFYSNGWDHDCDYHEDKESTMPGLDIQSGKNLAYILKGETKTNNFCKSTAAAEMSIAFLSENAVLGLKVEDQIAVGKQLTLTGNAGFVACQDDEAYGTNVELCKTDEDNPIHMHQVSLGLSIVKHRDNLICGCNVQSQFSIGSSSKLNIKAGLNNKLRGQISMKTNSSDTLQIAALALLPVVKAIVERVFPQFAKDSST